MGTNGLHPHVLRTDTISRTLKYLWKVTVSEEVSEVWKKQSLLRSTERSKQVPFGSACWSVLPVGAAILFKKSLVDHINQITFCPHACWPSQKALERPGRRPCLIWVWICSRTELGSHFWVKRRLVLQQSAETLREEGFQMITDPSNPTKNSEPWNSC